TPKRQVASAVASNALGAARCVFEVVLQICGQNLGRRPALREDDQRQVALQKLRRDPPGFTEVRPADAQLLVDDRRVHEHEEFLAARRAALLYQLERLTGEAFRQL